MFIFCQFKIRYYYGNDNGVFRISPSSPEDCPTGESNYDPRVRPWYVAASSGPKDVIIVLDVSGSMSQYGRLSLMKEAAIRVVNTLGASDYVSVIQFESNARHVTGGGYGQAQQLQRATDENKKNIVSQIKGLEANGGTNFYQAFDLAFRDFIESDAAEKSSGCNKAILFLTDGEMQDDKTNLMNMISSYLGEYVLSNRKKPILFTYTLGSGADLTVPKEIACQHDGIWSNVSDGDDLATSMGAYYKYFAYGLSGEDNADFVAWVSPYTYSTTGELGTTASAPVYDRSVDPPVLAGVVGLDFSFAAMERALGEEGSAGKEIVIEKIVERSVARCPNLQLTTCQLESLREYGTGGSQCFSDSGCEIQTLQSPLCQSPYPTNLWINKYNRYRTYEEKVCCTVGEDPRIAGTLSYEEIQDLVCEIGSNTGMIIGGVVGGVLGLILLVYASLLCLRMRNKKKEDIFGTNNNNSPPVVQATAVQQGLPTNNEVNASLQATVVQQVHPTNDNQINASWISEPDVVILPPPTAPGHH